MKSGINPLLRTPRSSIATLMAIVALMALIAACGGGDPEELTFDLEIKDRQLNIGVIEAKQDDTVTLNISSDEPGQFHLHGYDYEEDISPDAVTVLVFEANATGKFNITFHSGSGHTEDEEPVVADEAHDDDDADEEEDVLIGSLEVQPR